MLTVRIWSELKTSLKSVDFASRVEKNSRYFVGIFIKTIIPLTLVGDGMIIAKPYPMRTREIIVT